MPEPHPDHLIWLDLEMTGLDPEREVIIEIAVLITDGTLNILAEGPVLAVHQPDAALEAMDDWCRKTHGKSGLTRRVRQSTIEIEEAERLTLEFVRAWTLPGTSPLCGNSIAHDRRFIRRYMPLFEEHLHYRLIDVSSVKELVRRWYPPDLRAPVKKGNHLALDDIRESVEELRWYRENVFVPPGG
jgi:oligoribonuclease